MHTEKEYSEDRCLTRVHSESTGDYTLPDYNGDVKKILMIRPRVVPSGKFLGDDSVEFSGAVNYDVVYVDSENNVTHTDFSTDYDISVRVAAEKYLDSDIDTVISNYNVRLTGPRKFSAKCQLESEVHIGEKSVVSVAGDAFESYEPEVSVERVRVAAPCFFGAVTKELSEELVNLEGAICDEVEVLMCSVTPRIKSISATEGGAEVKGDVAIDLIYKNMDSVEEKVSKVLPFTENVSGDDMSLCDSLVGDVCVILAKTSVSPTEDGVSVMLNSTLETKVRGVRNDTLDIVTDAYLKERGTTNEYTDFNYTEYICTDTSEDNFSVRVPLDDLSLEGACEFLHVIALPHTESCEILDNSVKISGEIKFVGIACEINEDGMPVYNNVKTTVPFEHYVNVSCQTHDNMRSECHVSTDNARMEVDGDHLLLLCDLSSRVTLNSRKRQRCLGLSNVTDDEYSSDDSVVTVYYPDSGESIFSIAKRFHTSVRRIAEDNSLSESVFASPHAPLVGMGTKKLIIK